MRWVLKDIEFFKRRRGEREDVFYRMNSVSKRVEILWGKVKVLG